MGVKELRAIRIEELVRERYTQPDVDAADLAYEVLRKNPSMTDDEAVQHVAQLILQP